ncbi:hypothetical protein [Sutcliffiella deserti]|uniref:hypothetical protein n=1 Tax=Sutcliffiella deserti TaxID=2875501 RepID=UPI001CBDB2BE|nr:hypothetical protein [Sutcliffiella deserti]
MKNEKLLWLAWSFIIICIMAGGILGVYLIGREEGVFDMDLVLSVVIGTLGGAFFTIVFSIWKKKRKRNIPEFDERNLSLMKRYFLIALYFIIFGSGALLLVLFFMGVETIDVGMLIVYMMVLYLIVGLGALVTAKL